ncbi:hypothetical protein MN0502_14390 [Arthrobacter sp. MN05-02]|nr:hypothetical protein MN0502_14390 [Arthrobacter sp. MN05-02]
MGDEDEAREMDNQANDVFLGQVLAQLRSVTDRVEQLTQAIESRDVIGQAKGILMERYQLTPDDAFALLVACSTQSNTKLACVASRLVTSGSLQGLTKG